MLGSKDMMLPQLVLGSINRYEEGKSPSSWNHFAEKMHQPRKAGKTGGSLNATVSCCLEAEERVHRSNSVARP